MATIKDVAKEAGVSVATVSRVTNHSPNVSQTSITSVTEAMIKLGYRPNANARALVRQSSNTVGVLVGDVSDPFFGSMVKAIDGVAREQGSQILIGNGYHNACDEKRALDLLISSRCEVIIAHAKGLGDEALLEYMQEVPSMVLINRYIPEVSNRCIALDNYKGAYMATEFLIRQGHKQIACIASSRDIEDTQLRIKGYLAALLDNQIMLSKSYIEYGEPNSQGGEHAMTHLLSKSLPITAIFSYNDNMAAGALTVLEQNNIDVPNKVSLMGFDDSLIAKHLRPSLTTVHYPITLMAERAARSAFALIHGETLDDNIAIFSPTVVRRHSVSPCQSASPVKKMQ